MNKKSDYNHFIDILYFVPRKIFFTNKAVFLAVLEAEALKRTNEGFLPAKNLKALINKFLKDLGNHLVIADTAHGFSIEQLDAFKVLASVSILQESSLILKKKKAIAHQLIAKSISYSETSAVKKAKNSEQIMEVAKRYKGVDDEVFTYLKEYSKCWEEEENGAD